MKNTKIVALVAAVALLVLGTAFTSFAAAKYNWYQEDGVWHCKDKNGDDISQDVAKSGSDYYYLDENGEMATELLVDIDGDLYYFDADGKMVKNDWRKIENTEDDEGDEYYYYWFQTSGKAKKSTKTPVTIRDKKYMFDDDARMMYGWIDADVASDDDYAWQTATYYAGDADDGAIKTGWQSIDVIDDKADLDFEEQTYWFWFGTNGKKFHAAGTTGENMLAEKAINGKKYAFDNRGVMVAEWEQTASQSSLASTSISSYYWFQDVSIGAKLKKAWFRIKPVAVINATDNEDGTPHWYYAKGDGTIYENCVKTIGGKKYAFNENGEMLAGLYEMEIVDGVLRKYHAIDSEAEIAKYITAGSAEKTVYFFGDEETDGSMKYNTVKTEIDGDEYTLLFYSTGAKKGQAVNGLKGSAWYVNGAKVKADADLKYQLFEVTVTEGKVTHVGAVKASTGTHAPYCLISSSGTIIKSGTKKDADGVKYSVTGYIATKVAE